MVGLRGLLWKKLQKSKDKVEEKKEEAKPKEEPKKEVKKEEKPKEEKEEVKPVEKPKSEEELRKIEKIITGKDEELRKQEELIKQRKIEMFRSFEELNTEKLRNMGYDINQKAIRCVICREWKVYEKDKLSDLIKKNDIDILWKYVCHGCRKNMKRRKRRISEKYAPEIFIGSE